MSKTIVAGNVFVIKSKLTPEDFELLAKHNEEALYLHDDKGGRTFGLSYNPFSKGSVGRCGVTFNAASLDDEGAACVTVQLPNCIDDAKDYIASEYGAIIDKVKQVEAELPAAISAIKSKMESIKAEITTA